MYSNFQIKLTTKKSCNGENVSFQAERTREQSKLFKNPQKNFLFSRFRTVAGGELRFLLMCSEQDRRGPDTFATRIVSIAKGSDCFLKRPDDGPGGSGVFSHFLISTL